MSANGVAAFNLDFSTGENGQPLFAAFPLQFDGAPVGGIACGVSSRFAGDMAAGNNAARSAFFGKIGLEPARVYGLKQVHSRDVLAVSQRSPPAAPADGMVSADQEIALSVTVADCLPVCLFDTESGAFGIVHSGWKGTGIVLRALSLMKERWQTRPEAVAAALGPCIGSCCYRVDEARAAAFEQEFGAPQGAFLPPFAPVTRRETAANGGGFFLDLKAANTRLLAGAGVRNIAVCGDCTFTDERLGSFRRQGEGFTRMVAIIYNNANARLQRTLENADC